MPLTRWTLENPPRIREGYVLFSTRIVPRLPQSYHAMIVFSATVESETGARVRICDMAPPLRFGIEPGAFHRLQQNSYVGCFDDLPTEEYRQVLAAAYSLRDRPPNPDGTYGVYWLGTHGVDVPDPNDPGASIKAPHCSCASLVEWCYEEIGVDLVFANDLPHYSSSEVKSLFCPWISEEELFERLETFGLPAPGPTGLELIVNGGLRRRHPLGARMVRAVGLRGGLVRGGRDALQGQEYQRCRHVRCGNCCLERRQGASGRQVKPNELRSDWDPATDLRLTVWESLHHLVSVLEVGPKPIPNGIPPIFFARSHRGEYGGDEPVAPRLRRGRHLIQPKLTPVPQWLGGNAGILPAEGRFAAGLESPRSGHLDGHSAFPATDISASTSLRWRVRLYY
jgi:hypothetical protein